MKIKRSDFILTQNQKTYNSIASQFSNTRDRSWPEFDDFVKKHIKEGQSVLDIGCGNGRVFDLLKNKKINYNGIDISEGLINEARQKYPNINFQVGDILNLDYNNKFDVVFCIAVLNHIPTLELQKKALENIYKSLKLGGYLLLTNWNMWNIKNKKSWWRLKSKYFNVITFWGKEKLILYYYAFTLRKLNRLLKNIGFEIIENYYSLENKKVSWWQGKNIVHIVKK